MRYTKRRSQARPGNVNAKKCPVWQFDDLDLTNPDSCILFLTRLVKATWIGEIGTRQAGCMNNSIRTILSYYLDAKRLREMEEYFLKMKAIVDGHEVK
jgi:hypothetical protein